MSFHVITILSTALSSWVANVASQCDSTTSIPPLVVFMNGDSPMCVGTPVEPARPPRGVLPIMTTPGCQRLTRTQAYILDGWQHLQIRSGHVEVNPWRGQGGLTVIPATATSSSETVMSSLPTETHIKNGIDWTNVCPVIYNRDERRWSSIASRVMSKEECDEITTGFKKGTYFCVEFEAGNHEFFAGSPYYTIDGNGYTVWGIDSGIPTLGQGFGTKSVRIYFSMSAYYKSIRNPLYMVSNDPDSTQNDDDDDEPQTPPSDKSKRRLSFSKSIGKSVGNVGNSFRRLSFSNRNGD